MSPSRSFVPTSDRRIAMECADELRRQMPETKAGGVGARERVCELATKGEAKGDEDGNR